MELINWWILPLAALLAAAAWWLAMKRRRHVPDGTPAAHTDRLTALPAYRNAVRRYRLLLAVLAGCGVVVLLASAFAAARPVQNVTDRPEQRNRDIMLCLDASGSMSDADAAVVGVFRELAAKFDGERIGLTVFDSSAAQLFPLTDDYGLVLEQLEQAQAAFEGTSDSTALLSGTWLGPGSSLIGDGLASCVQGLPGPNDGSRPRSVIFATDNVLAGEPIFTLEEAAGLAADKEARIYALNPGDFDYGSDPGQPGAQLRAVAEESGGAYYSLDSAEAVPGIVRQVQETEAAAIEGSPRRIVHDQAGWPLGIALLGGVLVVGLAWRAEQ
ncbi:VWA domain-containing protein [Pseudarthrobacter sp. J64]|uniref:vWA domain-containing protein n=1 Tax=Pseudarthrobacter sp. J64 TaxID=3116485 RepID=UPI002E81A320|nr:VWA domain-containing protein [Pseudarthrobacter sp. J64]MEE2568670.1 VWA domain-containing protein [Pseudarthrobacter sp. J64]